MAEARAAAEPDFYGKEPRVVREKMDIGQCAFVVKTFDGHDDRNTIVVLQQVERDIFDTDSWGDPLVQWVGPIAGELRSAMTPPKHDKDEGQIEFYVWSVFRGEGSWYVCKFEERKTPPFGFKATIDPMADASRRMKRHLSNHAEVAPRTSNPPFGFFPAADQELARSTRQGVAQGAAAQEGVDGGQDVGGLGV